MPAPPPASAPKGSARAVLARVLVGTLVGLVLVEVGFAIRDAGAFPHLNVYEPDATLGARLRPGASQRFRFAGNPVSHVRINDAGLRGPELGPASRDEVVFIGDSQVFGLGVEEHEAFVFRVGRKLGRPVVNAGIPTHGPIEFAETAERILRERRPGVLVYTVNLANDLFEVSRPNRERHGVWDGWAVRIETMPDDVFAFPGRRWLFSQSHAVYAARRLLYEPNAHTREHGFPSEGDHESLIRASETEARQRREAETSATNAREARRAQIDGEVARIASGVQDDVWRRAYMDYDGDEDVQVLVAAASGQPGDIVEVDTGEESSRSVRITASHVRRAVTLRRQLEAQLRREAYRTGDYELIQTFERRDALVAESDALSSAPIELVADFTPMYPHLVALKALCDRYGARLVVLALPIDVQVSSAEWDKYGAPRVDMRETRVLVEDVARAATSLGATGIDPTRALERAEPGAFLDGDIHLSPKGHDVVANAIARAIREPAPLLMPRLGLPEGRSRVPTPAEMRLAVQIGDVALRNAGCEAMRVREWVRLRCRARPDATATGIVVENDPSREAMRFVSHAAVSVTVPIARGASVTGDVLYESGRRSFAIVWAADADAPVARLGQLRDGTGAAFTEEARTREACACLSTVERARVGVASDCAELYGALHEPCFTTYADDCERLVACLRGDVSALPTCATGSAHVGASARCLPLCDVTRPCPAQTMCTEWQGARACM